MPPKRVNADGSKPPPKKRRVAGAKTVTFNPQESVTSAWDTQFAADDAEAIVVAAMKKASQRPSAISRALPPTAPPSSAAPAKAPAMKPSVTPAGISPPPGVPPSFVTPRKPAIAPGALKPSITPAGISPPTAFTLPTGASPASTASSSPASTASSSPGTASTASSSPASSTASTPGGSRRLGVAYNANSNSGTNAELEALSRSVARNQGVSPPVSTNKEPSLVTTVSHGPHTSNFIDTFGAYGVNGAFQYEGVKTETAMHNYVLQMNGALEKFHSVYARVANTLKTFGPSGYNTIDFPAAAALKEQYIKAYSGVILAKDNLNAAASLYKGLSGRITSEMAAVALDAEATVSAVSSEDNEIHLAGLDAAYPHGLKGRDVFYAPTSLVETEEARQKRFGPIIPLIGAAVDAAVAGAAGAVGAAVGNAAIKAAQNAPADFASIAQSTNNVYKYYREAQVGVKNPEIMQSAVLHHATSNALTGKSEVSLDSIRSSHGVTPALDIREKEQQLRYNRLMNAPGLPPTTYNSIWSNTPASTPPPSTPAATTPAATTPSTPSSTPEMPTAAPAAPAPTSVPAAPAPAPAATAPPAATTLPSNAGDTSSLLETAGPYDTYKRGKFESLRTYVERLTKVVRGGSGDGTDRYLTKFIGYIKEGTSSSIAKDRAWMRTFKDLYGQQESWGLNVSSRDSLTKSIASLTARLDSTPASERATRRDILENIKTQKTELEAVNSRLYAQYTYYSHLDLVSRSSTYPEDTYYKSIKDGQSPSDAAAATAAAAAGGENTEGTSGPRTPAKDAADAAASAATASAAAAASAAALEAKIKEAEARAKALADSDRARNEAALQNLSQLNAQQLERFRIQMAERDETSSQARAAYDKANAERIQAQQKAYEDAQAHELAQKIADASERFQTAATIAGRDATRNPDAIYGPALLPKGERSTVSDSNLYALAQAASIARDSTDKALTALHARTSIPGAYSYGVNLAYRTQAEAEEAKAADDAEYERLFGQFRSFHTASEGFNMQLQAAYTADAIKANNPPTEKPNANISFGFTGGIFNIPVLGEIDIHLQAEMCDEVLQRATEYGEIILSLIKGYNFTPHFRSFVFSNGWSLKGYQLIVPTKEFIKSRQNGFMSKHVEVEDWLFNYTTYCMIVYGAVPLSHTVKMIALYVMLCDLAAGAIKIIPTKWKSLKTVNYINFDITKVQMDARYNTIKNGGQIAGEKLEDIIKAQSGVSPMADVMVLNTLVASMSSDTISKTMRLAKSNGFTLGMTLTPIEKFGAVPPSIAPTMSKFETTSVPEDEKKELLDAVEPKYRSELEYQLSKPVAPGYTQLVPLSVNGEDMDVTHVQEPEGQLYQFQHYSEFMPLTRIGVMGDEGLVEPDLW